MCATKTTYPQQNSYETGVQLIYKTDMIMTNYHVLELKKIMFYCI